MWATLGLTGLAIVAYANPRVPLELTSAVLVALLLVLFYIAPIAREPGGEPLGAVALLKGFANPAIIAVVALLVIGQGMVRTGALDFASRRIYLLARGRPAPAIAMTLIVALSISALLNNTPVVVMFIPILAALADRLGHSASRLMMPLSFCAILGGMTTLIGSSTNLLVSGTAVQLGLRPLRFFDFTIPGLVLAGIGLLYVLFVAPRLMPKRRAPVAEQTGSGGKQFVAQFTVTLGSSLTGAKAVGGMFPALRNMTVLMIERGENVIQPPFEDIRLEPDDLVIVAATRNALTEAVARDATLYIRPSPVSRPAQNVEGGDARAPQGHLVAEVMVSPGSRMVDLPLEQVAFAASQNISVLGIQRRLRMSRARINELRLEAGDVLLVRGRPSDIQALRANRDVVLMEWSASELPAYRHAGRAVLIFLAVVGLAASGVVPITITALCGAALMIVTGCLNIRQAGRAIDRQIVMVGGAALALDAALTATGGATFIADSFLGALHGAGPAIVLSAFFLLVAVITNVLTNNACAVLFTPIAVNIAYSLGVDPMIFVITVILAANCSFATPIGYLTNLLVMAPGRYRFTDYLRVGGPLIILLWVAFSLFAPWYYGLW